MIRKKFWGLALAFACTFSSNLLADSVSLNSDHPERYTVVKGDTLWGISEQFLNDPWRWPDVWHVNKHIENPHLIYPGDEIELTYVDGEPRLNLRRGGGVDGVVKLSPHIRESDIAQAIPTIPLDAIHQFLNDSGVVSENELQQSPYVVAFPDDRIIVGGGDSVYVRTIESKEEKNFKVFRKGKPLIDPETKELLGYAAIHVGDGNLTRTGDPATVFLTRTSLQVEVGDRLKPAKDEAYDSHFMPRPPKADINGYIIHVLNGVSRIGQFNTVVINKGKQDGLEVGHVLNIWQAGNVVRDRVSSNPTEKVKLPDELAGYLMAYRIFDRVSYALVMKAEKEITLLDVIKTP